MDTQEGNTNKTTPQRKPLILRLCAGLFILIFTVGFMLIGGGIIYSACRKDASYTGTATGTVMGYVSRPGDVDDSFQYFYAPVIRYETMEGSFCTGTGNVWTSGYPFEVGEQISIRYNPEQTDVINVEGYGVSVSYKLGAGLFLFGFAISVLLLIFFLKKAVRDSATRERIMGKLTAAIIVLLISGVWCMLAGIKITLVVFGILGLYALYQHCKKRREP